MHDKIKVTVWNEFRHEQANEAVKKLYPQGMHAVTAEAPTAAGDVTTCTGTISTPIVQLLLDESHEVVCYNRGVICNTPNRVAAIFSQPGTASSAASRRKVTI